METPSSSMRDVARRLLAASQVAAGPHMHEAVVVSERLRIPLIRFAGIDGFASLLRRSLLLASAEVPSLQTAKVGAGGRLEGLEPLVAGTGTGEAAVALASHLLGLLITFIGEPLTLAMVHEAWPDTSTVETHPTIKARGTETA